MHFVAEAFDKTLLYNIFPTMKHAVCRLSLCSELLCSVCRPDDPGHQRLIGLYRGEETLHTSPVSGGTKR